ncbi:CMGC family protein kinase [Tritrichomonas foetus]|uniref:CMGC family protein kinase n=1 Tax=Tritrichomonas foetus TaxID=1144522 RepID=A0A1J4KYV1_9EUKA|nr:CMGC family protein kinase [Tritrichomonas foetus]|eukprot:OHT14886.1 CMGC family protein kinase [Tritrichomonas foetus]
MYFHSNTQIKNRCTHVDQSKFFKYVKTFTIFGHRCFIMEYLGKSCFDLLKDQNNIGFELKIIQNVLKSVLQTLSVFDTLQIIHCDVKPENILQNATNNQLYTLIDFGLCSIVKEQFITYIQSRFYRSPEVIFNDNITTKADIWSLGCVAGELFLGVPLFPCSSEVQLLYLMDMLVGPFPKEYVKRLKCRGQYFNSNLTLKSFKRLSIDSLEFFDEGHPFFIYNNLAMNVMRYDRTKTYTEEDPASEDSCLCPNQTHTDVQSSETGEGVNDDDNGGNSVISEKEMEQRQLFLDIMLKMLKLDPNERPNAETLLNHPFIQAKLD